MEKQTKDAECPGGDDPFLLLTEDSLIQILVRLPIKSLLRFKSVSKSWLALIQTSYFIHLHTTFNSSSSSSKLGGTFILQALPFTDDGDVYTCTDDSWHKFTGGGGGGDWHWDNTNCVRYWVSDGRDWLWDETNGRWYWVGDDQEELFKADDDDNQLLLKLDNLELPSCYKSTFRNAIQGSCNGLICLYDHELGVVSLCNPATRQSRILPKPITIEKGVDSHIFLFGFDVKTKDYKVLLITYSIQRRRRRHPDYSFRVQVYSLSTDSWRLLEDINSFPTPMSDGLYLNGSCFFLVANVYHPESNTYNRFINSFDFTKEIFTTTQLPDHHHHRQHLFLYCLGGEKMALFTTLRKTPSGYLYEDVNEDDDPCGYDDCDIWALNEQGCCGGVNKETWTKLHSFQIKNTRCVTPRGISNNGKFVLLETTGSSYATNMQLYNLATKEAKVGFLRCMPGVGVSTVNVYKPSLVSIIGGNGNGAAAAPAMGYD